MDIIHGLEDALNPLPLLGAMAASHTVRMSAIKITLVSMLFVVGATWACDAILHMVTLSPNLQKTNISALFDTLVRAGFAVVPPVASAAFKADLVRHVKRRERTKTAPFRPTILDTIEKVIFVVSLRAAVSLFSGAVLRGAVGVYFRAVMSCCLNGFYLMEPRWQSDGMTYKRMFGAVEQRWLYLALLGSGPYIIDHFVTDGTGTGTTGTGTNVTRNTLLLVSLWQVVAGFNGITRWRHLRSPVYPALPLFHVQYAMKRKLIERLRARPPKAEFNNHSTKADGGKADGGKADGGKVDGGKVDGGKVDGGKVD